MKANWNPRAGSSNKSKFSGKEETTQRTINKNPTTVKRTQGPDPGLVPTEIRTNNRKNITAGVRLRGRGRGLSM